MAKAVNIARSHRLDGIGEYYFSRRLREIAEIEAATGRQIVKLAMGSPDLPPHQSVIDRLAREAQRPDVHKYMSYQGEPILRKAFADWYKKWYHVELDYRSEVYPLIGSKEGIMHICMTFLNPGDKVLVPNPGYPTYSAGVKLAGGVMVPYSLNKQTNFYPDFEAIERAGLDGVKMMLVNYPNMPTGQVGSMELFEKIIDFGARHNILIVHDNPYSFIRNSAGPLSIMAVEEAKEVALELNSLSKGHSMAGWRVGVLVGKAEWLKDVMTFRSNMDPFRPPRRRRCRWARIGTRRSTTSTTAVSARPTPCSMRWDAPTASSRPACSSGPSCRRTTQATASLSRTR